MHIWGELKTIYIIKSAKSATNPTTDPPTRFWLYAACSHYNWLDVCSASPAQAAGRWKCLLVVGRPRQGALLPGSKPSITTSLPVNLPTNFELTARLLPSLTNNFILRCFTWNLNYLAVWSDLLTHDPICNRFWRANVVWIELNIKNHRFA